MDKKFKISWKWVIGSIVLLIVLYNVIFTSKSVPQYKTENMQHGALKQSVDITSTWTPIGYSKVTLGSYQDVRKINVHEGQTVKKGDMIAQLNDDAEANQFRSAQVAFWGAAKAKKDAPALTPQSTLDSMQSQVNSAYYQMKNAEVALNKKKIKAPIAGKVTTIYYNDFDAGGSSLTGASGSNYITIVNASTPTFVTNLSEKEVDQVAINNKVAVTSRLRLDGYTGKITRIFKDPTVVAGSDPTYPVEIMLDKYPDVPFGAKIEGSIVVKEAANTTYLPYDAVTIDGVGKGSVLVLDGEGNSMKKDVTIGLITDNDVEITGGLSDSDNVIIDTLPDKKVTIVQPWLTNIFKK